MRYAIISDIHANDEALASVLADAYAQGAERIVCLGDVVGYGPMPSETVTRLRAVAAAVVAGNHDDAVSGRSDSSDFIDIAADAVQRHREAISASGIDWLKTLPYTIVLDGGALASHGDFTEPKEFRYLEKEADAAANFNANGAQLMFVGHTHTPALFLVGASGTVYSLSPQDFTLEDGKRYIVNPGSVGYPRESNGACRSSYVIYDSVERTVSYRYLPFAVASLLQRGETPRRIKRRTIGVIAAAAAALVGCAVWLLTPKTEVTKIVNVTETHIGEDPSLMIDRRSLTIPVGAKYVRAILKVENGPVQLRIVFADANAREIAVVLKSVKKSAAGREKIPAGAISACFTVSRPHKDSAATLTSFAPVAEN